MTTTDSTPSQTTTVLLVGHCTPDNWMLRTAVARVLPDAVFESVNDEEFLKKRVRESAGPVVMLVNRMLDGQFPHADGIRLLEHHASSAAVGMLVSNLADAQDSAREVGAVEGFGKTALNDDETAVRLRNADAAAQRMHAGADGS
ncbi:MAG: hypothetical protein P8J59_07050 [Phycisphaerales bacterium]|jgi:hypothetical protein|nr:hypothetical protein [Phycisphaerales bacterium]